MDPINTDRTKKKKKHFRYKTREQNVGQIIFFVVVVVVVQKLFYFLTSRFYKSIDFFTKLNNYLKSILKQSFGSV